jgi:hypothetical protein
VSLFEYLSFTSTIVAPAVWENLHAAMTKKCPENKLEEEEEEEEERPRFMGFRPHLQAYVKLTFGSAKNFSFFCTWPDVLLEEQNQ